MVSKSRGSKKPKRSYRRHRAQTPQERVVSDNRIRQQLLDLRDEIEEDIAAFRIDPVDYTFCKAMIEQQLDLLDQPTKPGELRVIGLPKKHIDWDKLKQVTDEINAGQAKKSTKRRGPATPTL